jgi:hypothetical protein
MINSNSVLLNLKSASRLFFINQTSNYSSRGVRNILRNRYDYRNKDGSFKEYNESITLIPKEFEHQGILKLNLLIYFEIWFLS